MEGHEFAPPFSIWTLIEECLNPPVVWERERGWFTTPPFSEPEVFDFPAGIGPLECVNVEHEEVLLMPRWVDVRERVTFKYGLGCRLSRRCGRCTSWGFVDGAGAGRRRVGVAARGGGGLPARPGDARRRDDRQDLRGAVGARRREGRRPREVYLYHVVDNAWSMREYGCQAVVWQTAINPVVALELLATGAWSGTGVLGPEAFDAVPFLDLLTEYGSPWEMREGG